LVVDEYGTIGYTQQEVVDHLRINPNFDIHGLFLTDGEQYENARRQTSMEDIMPEISIWGTNVYISSVEDYHKELQKAWLMPEEYDALNIQKYILSKCKTHAECERVDKELRLYEELNLMNLLRYLKYLKDLADKNNIVWGVGRGSSCCSYCLYLMGIHRVDSMKYNLEITDFLRG
jgi:DNA polymerase III alpha subunit